MRRCLAIMAVMSFAMVSPAVGAKWGKEKEDKPAQQSSGGTFDAAGNYQLGEDEQKLDCKKLSGRIHIRLLQMRSETGGAAKRSPVAEELRKVTTPTLQLMFGGGRNTSAPAYGADSAADHRRDLAILNAYNKQLSAKNCRVYDIDAELKKGPSDPPPSPVAPAKK